MEEFEEAKKIIESSGNSFHCKVNEKIKELGWYTQVSPYYLDSIANKPREIDLIAEKSYKFNDMWGA